METRARYTLIGAFTLAVLFGCFTFLYWLKNVGGLGERAIYDIRFEQPVSGITPGTNVLFNGIRVGAVARVDLDPANPKRVNTQISIDPQTPVRADTLVDVTYQGFTGAAAIALKGGSLEAPRMMPENGHPPMLIAGPDVGRSLTESAQQTLHRLDDILDQNAKPLNTTITGIATFAEMLSRNTPRIEGLLGGLENLVGGGAQKQGPATYDLSAASNFPEAQKTLTAQLVVSDPSAIILFDSQKILIRSEAGTYSNVSDAQWASLGAKSVEGPDAVSALNRAFVQVAEQIVNWTVEAI
jgi:phospholipid/cholesterol/gamma-HCH transport system substrate-binding protein